MEEGVTILRRAWAGQRIQRNGVELTVTPRPVQQPSPPIILGGNSKAAARRAARIADGFFPVLGERAAGLYDVFRDERERLGLDADPPHPPEGPMFLCISEDPDRTWARIAANALHETNSYAAWLEEGNQRRRIKRSATPMFYEVAASTAW